MLSTDLGLFYTFLPNTLQSKKAFVQPSANYKIQLMPLLELEFEVVACHANSKLEKCNELFYDYVRGIISGSIIKYVQNNFIFKFKKNENIKN